jgi:hypothetical protein
MREVAALFPDGPRGSFDTPSVGSTASCGGSGAPSEGSVGCRPVRRRANAASFMAATVTGRGSRGPPVLAGVQDVVVHLS